MGISRRPSSKTRTTVSISKKQAVTSKKVLTKPVKPSKPSTKAASKKASASGGALKPAGLEGPVRSAAETWVCQKQRCKYQRVVTQFDPEDPPCCEIHPLETLIRKSTIEAKLLKAAKPINKTINQKKKKVTPNQLKATVTKVLARKKS